MQEEELEEKKEKQRSAALSPDKSPLYQKRSTSVVSAKFKSPKRKEPSSTPEKEWEK